MYGAFCVLLMALIKLLCYIYLILCNNFHLVCMVLRIYHAAHGLGNEDFPYLLIFTKIIARLFLNSCIT